MFLAGCSSLPPNHSADELKQWAKQKNLSEEFKFDKPPRKIYNTIVPCLMTRYRHRGWNNRHTYSDRQFNKESNSGYFAVNKNNDHIYIEALEIFPENENSSVLIFYGYDREHLDRLVANAFHVCKLSEIVRM